MADSEAIRGLLDERILVLDGAWGTMLQAAGLAPRDYRGEIFGEHPHDVAGDPDILNLTRPDLILDIHRQYLAAGADITTTNTFTATSIGQADYGLQASVRDMNLAGARLARQAADEAGGLAGRQAGGRLGRAAERHAVAVAAGRRSGVPDRELRPRLRRLRRADDGAGRGRRRTCCWSRRSSTPSTPRRPSPRPATSPRTCRCGSPSPSSTCPAGRCRARRWKRSGPPSSTPGRSSSA